MLHLVHKRPPRRADDDGDLESLLSGGEKKFHVSCMGPEEGPKTYNAFIYEEITSPKQFVGIIEALQVATEHDTVLIHLSTPGGSVDATDTFLNALRYAEAKVVFIASGGVHSAGSLILMHADNIVFSDGFNSLIHNGAVGFGAKFSDWTSAATFTKKAMESLFRRTYRGFLTDTELDELIAGKDFWMDGDEFSDRLERRNELLAPDEEVEAVG